MVGKTNNGDANSVSVFKKVFSRHKRKGNDRNRIDDLLNVEADGSGVIDVTRFCIRKRPRNGSNAFHGGNSPRRNHKEKNPASNNGETIITGNVSDPNDDLSFGDGQVVPLESMLPGVPGDGTNDDVGRRCSCFGFPEFPGVYLYPKALDQNLQLRIALEAVTEYCELGSMQKKNQVVGESVSGCGSHRTNIDLLPPKPHERVNEIDDESETMWNLWKQEQGWNVEKSQQTQHPSNANGGDRSNSPPPEKKAKRESQIKHSNINKDHYYRRFSKLSWATMGYHYDWTERSYHPQKKSKMPDLVARLSTIFATAKPTAEDSSSNSSLSFTPSASIVNYYTVKSTMGGHRDDLEDPNAMDKPIISISLGLPGIFILGGPTKDEYEMNHLKYAKGSSSDHENGEAPLPHSVRAILLRPGDVLVMGGPSRLNYHAMARVLPHEAALEYDRQSSKDTGEDTCHAHWFSPGCLSPVDLALEGEIYGQDSSISVEREYLVEYLRHHRVNINVRQVYPDDG